MKPHVQPSRIRDMFSYSKVLYTLRKTGPPNLCTLGGYFFSN